MTPAEAVVAHARRWWRGHRPVDWGLADHLETPAINCNNGSETQLARAVAKLYVRKVPKVRR